MKNGDPEAVKISMADGESRAFQVMIYIADAQALSSGKDGILPGIAPLYAKKYDQMKMPQEKAHELAAGWLLRKYLGVSSDDQLSIGENGKPSLSFPGPFFNLSHSGRFAALAVADCKIGLDLEQRMPLHEATVQKIFTQQMQDEARAAHENRKDEVFTQLWTRLEAGLKLDGTGFSEGWRQKSFDSYHFRTVWIGEYCITCASRDRAQMNIRWDVSSSKTECTSI